MYNDMDSDKVARFFLDTMAHKLQYTTCVHPDNTAGTTLTTAINYSQFKCAYLLSVQCNVMHMHWTEYKITKRPSVRPSVRPSGRRL